MKLLVGRFSSDTCVYGQTVLGWGGRVKYPLPHICVPPPAQCAVTAKSTCIIFLLNYVLITYLLTYLLTQLATYLSIQSYLPPCLTVCLPTCLPARLPVPWLLTYLPYWFSTLHFLPISYNSLYVFSICTYAHEFIRYCMCMKAAHRVLC